MKKRIITAAAFVACLALCATVWPQNKPAEETPTLPTPPTVTATQPEASEVPETGESTMTEEEKTEVTEPMQTEETITTPEPLPPPKAVPVVSAQESTPQQESESSPTSPDSTPENMVYVPGFGWLESQGPSYCKYAGDMYENGNKIGRMN